MQFRIGMFVIVAGLVLTMLIVWFGESPSLFRDQVYLTAHFEEAPGVAEGIPVRKSGIRVGEVAAIQFDNRHGKPDGVLVTLALERKYKIRAGSIPRVTRSLIGDSSIDLQPGTSIQPIRTHPTPAIPPDDQIVEGEVAADPSKAMAAATAVIQDAQGTLRSIDAAAQELTKVARKADGLDEFISSWTKMSQGVQVLAADIDRVVKDNEANFKPAVASLRDVSRKLNEALDAPTQLSLKTGIQQFSAASARMNTVLADVGPLAKDLGAPADRAPSTSAGQFLTRANRVAYDLGLLTSTLENPNGRGLNPNGSLQKLLIEAELYNNLNEMAKAAREVIGRARPAVDKLNTFAGKIANDPSAIGRGALSR